jgi:pimeloyl-ACP methyl ester carboxylesterase
MWVAAMLCGAIATSGCRMLQDRLMFFPAPAGENDVAAMLRDAGTRGMVLREWTVAGDGWGFIAEPRLAPASHANAPTALILHGNAGWAGDRLYYLAPLVSRGYRVVLVEYPGYGRRQGQATLENVLAATERSLDEAERAWSGPLVLIGESLGAGVIAQLARRHEARLAGIVLITPWDSLRTVARMHYPWLPAGLVLQHPMDSVAALKNFDRPVTILVAGRDEIVGAAGGQALAQALDAASLVLLPDAGHNDWPWAMTPAHWDELLAPLRAWGT